MKYLLTIFLSVFSLLAYSQNSDSLLYINCRNFQVISDSSLTINILSKTELKVWKDTTQKNTIFLDPKEEGIIKIALTNAENDTVQIMNYKAVLLPLPTIKLKEEDGRESFSISSFEESQRIKIYGIANMPNWSELIDNPPYIKKDLRYRVNNFSAYLEHEGKKIDSVFSDSPIIEIKSIMKNAKTGDKIIFRILNVQRMNYEEIRQNIPLNVEFEYPILD
jgi:hypothetical protein